MCSVPNLMTFGARHAAMIGSFGVERDDSRTHWIMIATAGAVMDCTTTTTSVNRCYHHTYTKSFFLRTAMSFFLSRVFNERIVFGIGFFKNSALTGLVSSN